VKRLIVRTILVVAGIACFASYSAASPIVFNYCNVSSVCGQAQVTTALDGSTVDVDVTDMFGGPAFGIFGDSGGNRAFAFNVVDPDADITISDLTSGFTYAGAGINVGGPFGDFEFVLNGPHTGSAALLPLHFAVTRPGGFSSSELFEANGDGYFFTAHLRNNDTGVTGWGAGGTPTDPVPAVPEPASLILLGTGVVSLVGRRLRRQVPPPENSSRSR
jgi:hypothetical protein